MTNNIFDKQDSLSVRTINDLTEYDAFLSSDQKGILCIPPSTFNKSQNKAVMPETYNFAKWIKSNNKDINIDVFKSEGVQHLRSGDFWMPVVFIASDVSLQVYLGLVTSYIYDMLKGALKHDKNKVHIKAIYKDSDGTTKEFSYSGSIEGLEKTIKKVDINKILE